MDGQMPDARWLLAPRTAGRTRPERYYNICLVTLKNDMAEAAIKLADAAADKEAEVSGAAGGLSMLKMLTGGTPSGWVGAGGSASTSPFSTGTQAVNALSSGEAQATAMGNINGGMGIVGEALPWFLALSSDDVVGLKTMLSATDGHPPERRALLLETRDGLGYSPWLFAATKDSLRAMKWLAELEGVDVLDTAEVDESMQDKTSQGWSALHLAAAYGNFGTLHWLLQSQPKSIDARSTTGCTPLIIAAMYGKALCVELLIRAGADMNAVDNLGDSALHWAAYKDFPAAVAALSAAGVGINGAIDRADQFGQSALHLAAMRGIVDTTKQLVALGADTELRDLQGKRPLDLVVSKLKLKNRELVRGQQEVLAFLQPTLSNRIVSEINSPDFAFTMLAIMKALCFPGYLRCLQAQVHEVSLHITFWALMASTIVCWLTTHLTPPGEVGLKPRKVYEEEFATAVAEFCETGKETWSVDANRRICCAPCLSLTRLVWTENYLSRACDYPESDGE
jgi:ankyrin repeat protein